MAAKEEICFCCFFYLRKHIRISALQKQSIQPFLTDDTLWGDEVRPDLDVLKLDFDEFGSSQLVQGQLSKPIHGAEEHRLRVGTSLQGIADQTPALQEDFALMLPKCSGPRDAH